MNNMQVFLLTKVEKGDLASDFANFCLSPVRYVFHGRTIRIVPKDLPFQGTHHVRSFHKTGNWNSSRSNPHLRSSNIGFLKTVISIVLLIPGLCLGSIFKGLSYLSESNKEKHKLIKQHFTPTNKTIGSAENPLDEKQIQEELETIRKEPLHQKINALVIYGKNVELNTDPGFVNLNPKKVIFVGAEIVHKPSPVERLDGKLSRSKKWMSKVMRECKKDTFGGNTFVSVIGHTFVAQLSVKSVDEALNHQMPRRSGSGSLFKRYHGVYVVANETSKEI